MRFCIDFGTQNGSKIGPKSVRNFRFSSLGVASVFLSSRVASCLCFCIVGCSANLHFSLENKFFFKVFSILRPIARGRRRVAFSPSQGSKNLLRIEQNSFPNLPNNGFENTIDLGSIFGPKIVQYGSIFGPKMPPKWKPKSTTNRPREVPLDFGRCEVHFTPSGCDSEPILDPLWH